MTAPLTLAADAVETARVQRQQAQDRMALAFQRVFGPAKKPSDADRALVLNNLEALCNARAELMVVGEPDTTARRIGQFSVWQHIQNMRFPRRPPVASDNIRVSRGGTDEQTQEGGPQTADHGSGVAEPTD